MDYDSFLELVKKRRSVRRFKNEPIPRVTIERILEASRYAPSAGNTQPWEFIIVEDPTTKKSISKNIGLKIKTQTEKDQTLHPNAAVQPHLFTAPVLIVVCGDPRLRDAYPAWKDRNLLFHQSLSNCIYAMQLAAACFGLATAWATIQSGPTEIEVKKLLGIPDIYSVDHIVPLGYPDEEQENRPPGLRIVTERARFRRELKDIIHYEHYDMGKLRSDAEIKDFIWNHSVTRVPHSHV